MAASSIAVGESREQIEKLIEEDPFHRRGLARFRVIEFRASQRAPSLDAILGAQRGKHCALRCSVARSHASLRGGAGLRVHRRECVKVGGMREAMAKGNLGVSLVHEVRCCHANWRNASGRSVTVAEDIALEARVGAAGVALAYYASLFMGYPSQSARIGSVNTEPSSPRPLSRLERSTSTPSHSALLQVGISHERIWSAAAACVVAAANAGCAGEDTLAIAEQSQHGRGATSGEDLSGRAGSVGGGDGPNGGANGLGGAGGPGGADASGPGSAQSGGAAGAAGGAFSMAGASGGAVPMGGSAGSSTGGAGPAEATAPALVAPIALDDEQLAREALTLMGSSAVGASGSCASCHVLGRPTLTHWQQLTRAFADACLQDTELPDSAAVDETYACFESHASGAAGLSTSDFGIYSAAAHLPWFSFVFHHATATSDAPAAQLRRFVERVGMPRAGARWSQEQFDIVAEWFARGLPGLFALVPEDSGGACTPALDARLLTHLAEMRTEGWRAKNEAAPLLMFGCGAGERGAACLRSVPAASSLDGGAEWNEVSGTTIRILWDNSATPSTYWSRASADGRFIASGLVSQTVPGFSGQILDLQRGAVIAGNFAYDPTFFPDNSGFMVQRGSYSPAPPGGLPTDGTPNSADVAVTCDQSVLLGSPTQVTGDEPVCTSLSGQIGLYEQLAKSVDGDDYWVVYGAFGEDDGGFRPVLDNPAAAFETQSVTTLSPMINQGNGFEAAAAARVQTPLQGDPMLSASGRLLVTRVKGQEEVIVVDGREIVTAEQSGYALHLLSTVRDAGVTSATIEEVGRVCVNGSKAMLSYDERWMIIHHYVTDADASELGFAGADDPAFTQYRSLGAANLYLVDLETAQSQRITNMRPGQYALFPHFRSDGWIYFVVRTLDGQEYFAASDAALILETDAPSGL